MCATLCLTRAPAAGARAGGHVAGILCTVRQNMPWSRVYNPCCESRGCPQRANRGQHPVSARAGLGGSDTQHRVVRTTRASCVCNARGHTTLGAAVMLVGGTRD